MYILKVMIIFGEFLLLFKICVVVTEQYSKHINIQLSDKDKYQSFLAPLHQTHSHKLLKYHTFFEFQVRPEKNPRIITVQDKQMSA